MFTVQSIEMTERYLLYPIEPSVTFRLPVWLYVCFTYSHNFFHENSVQKIMIFMHTIGHLTGIIKKKSQKNYH